jgi:uncharacterized protein YndB with AHSA1/START domain
MRTSSSDRIQKTVLLNATRSRIWRALTDTAEFGQWFRVKLENRFVPGQKTSGFITYPGYEHLRFEVLVERMDAEHYFSFRWHPYAIDPKVDYSEEPTTLVEFRLEPVSQGTRLTLSESGFDKLPPERRDEAFRMNDGGWTIQTENIRKHVDS